MPVKRNQLNVSHGDNVTVGDVIQCSANTAHPPVSYYWQRRVNESWQQLQQDNDDGGDDDGSMLRLSTAGVYVLRCVAYNVIKHSTYYVTSQCITLYVYVKPGKCLRCVYETVKLCRH